MKKSYNLSGSSTPTRTEQCLRLSKGVEVQTERTLSLSKGSSSSFFKSFALAVAMLVVGIGSSWGQTVTIGTGTLQSATGTNGNPIYRSSATSSFHHSKSIQLITSAQLSAAGILSGSAITEWGYYKTTNGRPNGTNSWTLRVYLKNVPNTSLASGTTWNTWISGATLAYTATINSANMPSTVGYWLWPTSGFTYTGGAVICCIEWFPAGTMTSSFTTNSFRWQYTSSTSVQAIGASSGSTLSGTTSISTTNLRFYNTRITYTPPPACTGTPSPGNTISSSATVASGSTVNLSLSTPPTGTGLTYQWQSGPTSGGTWANISGATSSTYTATVTANTWYRCNVTCSGSTGNSTPVQVTLAACTPTAASDDATGITFVGFNTISNTSVGDPAYTNNTGISTSVFQNTAYPLTVRVNTAGAYTVNVLAWIDWNQNLTFEAGEQYNLGSALSVTDANTTASPFSITVPETALLGNTVMRVRATYSVAPTACGAQSYSEAEDYTINVQATPLATCPTLTSPANAATGVSLTPTLTWTAGANTSTYDVYLSTNQTDVNNQAVGARVSTSQAGTSYTSAALSPSTLYYWRVVPKNSFGTAATGCTTRSFTTSAPSPTISQSGSLSAFSACANVASTQQSFSVSGLYLSGNLVVTAPTGFSVSTTSGAGFTSSVSLTPSNSTVSSTLIYVRMNALASNPTSGNIVCSSTSASSVNVAVSGTVLESPTSASAGADVTICSGQSVSLVGSATGFSGSGSTSSSASSVYSGGNASSLYLTGPTTSSNNTTCPMDLTVSIPSGATITGVDVSYTVTAGGAGWLSENITYLECTSTGGAKEGTYSTAGGDNSGSAVLSRAALSIANSVAAVILLAF